jgi:hypothetical protein
MCPKIFNLWKSTFIISAQNTLVGDYSVGPHVLPHQLTDNTCRDFLLHDLPNLLKDVRLAVRARMWYTHDGSPAHFSRAVRDGLNNTCHDRRISSEGPTAWPPRSPDLNVPDFYLWRHLNTPLATKSHFTIALWMPIRLSATASASLNACGGPWWDVSRRAFSFMGDVLL